MYVCSCFGVTERQVKQHAEAGACTPRQIASACKAGTDCGSCVRRIQALLGRGACPRRELLDSGRPVLTAEAPEDAVVAPETPGAPEVTESPGIPAQAPVQVPALMPVRLAVLPDAA
ncbi:BFD domain-containing protein (2Fe-2S)-binding domain-containing protein [Streptomyces laurentii]|uniref:Bacterioferritin-associated ferredoxin n=1 Tax=Streptomyces laurentii TaxID=39478 RepID=A0A160NVH3_STRLU|nr:BFD domain-containing protein (2Fe-2S)-binding domain-containing protein [Streptomyces laurentii]